MKKKGARPVPRRSCRMKEKVKREKGAVSTMEIVGNVRQLKNERGERQARESKEGSIVSMNISLQHLFNQPITKTEFWLIIFIAEFMVSLT